MGLSAPPIAPATTVGSVAPERRRPRPLGRLLRAGARAARARARARPRLARRRRRGAARPRRGARRTARRRATRASSTSRCSSPSAPTSPAGSRTRSRDGVPLTGASDHFVSEAIYLRDPDGHGIEVYRDRPREHWEGQVDRHRHLAARRRRPARRARRPDRRCRSTASPPGTTMGHVHLRVAELPADDRVLPRPARLRADRDLRRPGGVPLRRRLPPPRRREHLGEPRRAAGAGGHGPAAARDRRPPGRGRARPRRRARRRRGPGARGARGRPARPRPVGESDPADDAMTERRAHAAAACSRRASRCRSSSRAPTLLSDVAVAAVAPLAPTPAIADDDDPTPEQTEGPYYTPQLAAAPLDRPGGRAPARGLTITGRVLTTAGRPVARRAARLLAVRRERRLRQRRLPLPRPPARRRARALGAGDGRARALHRPHAAHPRQGAGAGRRRCSRRSSTSRAWPATAATASSTRRCCSQGWRLVRRAPARALRLRARL